MTIEILTCTCGATLRIETDDQEFLEKAKRGWEREHEHCEQS